MVELESKQIKIRQDEYQLLESSFKVAMKKHQCLGQTSQSFLSEKIRELIEIYNKNYFGLFTAIYQSSGFGKTRACESLSNDNFYVAYCCLRDQASNDYPPRSHLAKFLLSTEDEITVEQVFICYFNMFIDILNDDRNISCEAFYEEYCQHKSGKLDELMRKKLDYYQNQKHISFYTGSNPLIFVFDESFSLFESFTTK